MKTTRCISLVALAAAASLGLAACGSDDAGDGGDATRTTTETVTESPSGSGGEEQSGESGTGSSSSSGSTTGGSGTSVTDVSIKDLEKIAATAEDEVSGTAYEMDDQDRDGTWEVDVAKDDDTSVEVTVSADGSKVVRTDDRDDTIDDDDRAGLDAAKITVVEAIDAAMKEADGTFDDAELESEGGKHFWEVSLDDADGHDIEVRVDVATGKATVQQDDDQDDDQDD